MELFDFIFVFDNDEGLIIGSAFDFEWPELHVFLDNRVVEFTTNESLGIKNCVNWVFGSLVFGCVSNESFGFSESDIGGSGSVSLIVGNDLNSFVLPDTNT